VTVETAAVERTTEVAVSRRAYRWLDAALPLQINMIAHRVWRAFQPIRITRFIPVTRFIPEKIQFWLALKRLQQAKSNIYAVYEKHHEEYRALDADAEQIAQLNYQESYELSTVDEKIHQLYSQHIIAQAERHFLPVPEIQDHGGDWEVARLTGRLRLRREALVFLLSAIRTKQRERREAAQAKLLWVTALTGMVGAVIGLISVLSR
jgi:hypothetical protein